MGYFDALTSGAFKTTLEGRRLFFPWGVLGRGYAIPTEQEYQRLHRLLKAYVTITIVAVIGSVVVLRMPWAIILPAIAAVFYLAWLPFLKRGLTPSAEKLTVTESMSAQARAHGVSMLWLLLIVSLVFVAAGVFILVVDPGNWLIAVLAMAFFGGGAVVFVRMLVLRRRANG